MRHSPGFQGSLLADPMRVPTVDATSRRATEVYGYPGIPGYSGRFLYNTMSDDCPEVCSAWKGLNRG
jgi:hypothetical protein